MKYRWSIYDTVYTRWTGVCTRPVSHAVHGARDEQEEDSNREHEGGDEACGNAGPRRVSVWLGCAAVVVVGIVQPLESTFAVARRWPATSCYHSAKKAICLDIVPRWWALHATSYPLNIFWYPFNCAVSNFPFFLCDTAQEHITSTPWRQSYHIACFRLGLYGHENGWLSLFVCCVAISNPVFVFELIHFRVELKACK